MNRTTAGASVPGTVESGAKAPVDAAPYPEVQVWAFDRWRKDHLALVDADTTFCGRGKNPHGFPTCGPFDPTANYDCKRCLATARKLGTVRVYFRFPDYELKSEVVTFAPVLTSADDADSEPGRERNAKALTPRPLPVVR